jgi:hypothetical protein
MTQHYVLTLETGVPKQLSSVLVGAEDKRRPTVWMQARATNGSPIYLGTNDDISDTNYGVRIPAPTSGEPAPPFNPGEFVGSPEAFRSPLKMSDFWVLGATGDYLHLMVVDY